MVHSGAGAGTYVGPRPISPTVFALRRVIRARRLIEIPAAASAVHQVDPEHLYEIELRRRSAATGASRFAAHRDFHNLLLTAGTDPLWRAMAAPMFDWLGQNINRERVSGDMWSTVDCDHQRIIEAVISRNAPVACEAMSNHLDRLASSYQSMVVADLATKTSTTRQRDGFGEPAR